MWLGHHLQEPRKNFKKTHHLFIKLFVMLGWSNGLELDCHEFHGYFLGSIEMSHELALINALRCNFHFLHNISELRIISEVYFYSSIT